MKCPQMQKGARTKARFLENPLVKYGLRVDYITIDGQ